MQKHYENKVFIINTKDFIRSKPFSFQKQGLSLGS